MTIPVHLTKSNDPGFLLMGVIYLLSTGAILTVPCYNEQLLKRDLREGITITLIPDADGERESGND